MVALVAGGSGGIGEGIVYELMKAGHTVYVPSREGDQSPRLREYTKDLGTVHTVEADLENEAEVVSLRDTILKEAGSIDAVIVSVGAYYYGYSLHRMPHSDFERSIRDNLFTHFTLQRVFADYMIGRQAGRYITLVGPESESIIPDEGTMSIMAASQKMMARVLAQEASGFGVHVHAITAHTSIRTRSRGSDVNPDWIHADDLGQYVRALVEGSLPGSGEVLHELRNRAHVQALLKRVAS